jgi:hypothetical protein
VIADAIPDAMLLPTNECFAKEVPKPVYTMSQICSMGFKSRLMAGQGTDSRLRFGDRRLLLFNDEAWRCHPYAQAL